MLDFAKWSAGCLYAQILGAEPHFLGDGIRRAFESRIAKPPQYGYSTEALVGRRQMLQIAHDTLTNQSSRTEYDRALSEDRDVALTMDVAWDKVRLWDSKRANNAICFF